MPSGSSTYDPYVCHVGSEIYQTNYGATFREFPAVACDYEYKEKFGPCAKIHYTVSNSNQDFALVQYKPKDSLFVCKMHDPNSPIEQKFDFTDKKWCTKCPLKQLFEEDATVVKKLNDEKWPKLTGGSDEAIAKYVSDALTFGEDECYFYVDKQSLNFQSDV